MITGFTGSTGNSESPYRKRTLDTFCKSGEFGGSR